MKRVASRTAAESKSPLRSFRESHASSAQMDSKATEWVDGSEPDSEGYDDEESDYGSHKLSKADRKRLRKQKRAA